MQLVNRVKNNSTLLSSRKPQKRDIILIAGLALVGAIAVLAANAAGTSTISGTAFYDLNRNGMQDPGEAPMAGESIYLVDEAGLVQVDVKRTDANGVYSFTGLSDATYQLIYAPEQWRALRMQWVPTTTGSVRPEMTVKLVGQFTANFGWRQIVYSSDRNAPLSSLVTSAGTTINSYTDAVTAADIYAELNQGSLFGKEGPYTKITFGYNNQSNFTDITVAGGPGNYTNYSADISLSYISWLDSGGNMLFHEYGHAWSYYYGYTLAQDTEFREYLKVRGIAEDSRLGSSHAWDSREMIAEDYRQLFGSPNAQSFPQENRDLSLAAAVPGLRDYLSGPFMQPNVITPPPPSADTISPTAPTNLTGRTAFTSEGSGVNLSWTASTDNVAVDKYLIYRNGIQVGAVDNSATIFADSSLASSTSYQYYVKASDAAGNLSAASATITVTTEAPDTQAPSKPSGLTSPSQTQTSINLKWNPSTDNVGVTGYRVYQIGSSGKNSFNTLITTQNGTSYTVTGLAKGKSYAFYIVAIDAAGNTSAPSTTLTVRTRR